MIDVIKNNYGRHRNHLGNLIPKSKKFDYKWLNNNSYDSWRHKKLYGLIDILLDPDDSWITIGDGRYGSDAHYLIQKGVKNVLATDISDVLLKIAKSDKFINKYKEVNAESINLKDNSFDYVYCKESFHHFPRPILALYEMIRISKKGVVLIEPNDTKALKDGKFENSFEKVGNYKYPISIREIEKILNGMGLPCMAYKGIDDIYLKDGSVLPSNSKSISIIKAKITLAILDLLYRIKLRNRSVVGLIIFKTRPDKMLLNKLKMEKYEIIVNQPNPY